MLRLFKILLPVVIGLTLAFLTANTLITLRLWLYHQTSFISIFLDITTKGLYTTVIILFIICTLVQVFLIQRLKSKDNLLGKRIRARTTVILIALSMAPGMIMTLAWYRLDDIELILLLNLVAFIVTSVYFFTSYFTTRVDLQAQS